MTQRRRDGITQRQVVRAAAVDANVSPDELDRAVVLGQIAILLTRHPKIGHRVAFKGGAIMHLVDNSPRHSSDLDGAVVTGHPLKKKWIEDAFATDEARKILRRSPAAINVTADGIIIPVMECVAIAGTPPITVKVSVNWLEPLVCEPEIAEINALRLGNPVKIPVVALCERTAEKIRAFLVRG